MDGVRARLPELPRPPGLAVILAGDDPASRIHVNSKARLAHELGYLAEVRTLPADAAEARILAEVAELNERDEIDGILVQLPLPGGVNTLRVMAAIDPGKDVDGLHALNAARLSGMCRRWPPPIMPAPPPCPAPPAPAPDKPVLVEARGEWNLGFPSTTDGFALTGPVPNEPLSSQIRCLFDTVRRKPLRLVELDGRVLVDRRAIHKAGARPHSCASLGSGRLVCRQPRHRAATRPVVPRLAGAVVAECRRVA